MVKKAASKKKTTKKAVTKKTVTKKSTVKKAAASKKKVSKKKASAKAAASVTYINNETRYRMVQEAAYLLSEKFGFDPNRDLENWLQAEEDIKKQILKDNLVVKD